MRAIAEIKILDPAVGSGAFPMSMLHKLTLALRRLDEDNELWKSVQIEKAGRRAAATFKTTDDQRERDAELTEISDIFEKYRVSDFGRKLYLIQNSIYGVDIPDRRHADSQAALLHLARHRAAARRRRRQHGHTAAAELGDALRRREHLAGAERRRPPAQPRTHRRSAPPTRRTWRQSRAPLPRQQSQQEAGVHSAEQGLAIAARQSLARRRLRRRGRRKIAKWDPFDQNESADWFDADYMFGIKGGFDVVIGNPPYRQVRKRTYSATLFPFSEGRDKGKQNLYKLFVEHSYNLCKDGGVATLIVQSSLMCDLSSAATRQLLLERTRLHHIIEFPKAAPTREAQLFQSVTQGTCIYQFTKLPHDDEPISISVDNDAFSIADLCFAPITKNTIENLYPSLRCFPRIHEGSTSILEKIASNKTIKPLGEYAVSIVQGDLNLTTHSKRFSNKPTAIRLIRGRNVGRFAVKYDTATEYCEQGFMPERVRANREGTFLISQEVTGTNDIRRLHFGLAEKPPTDFLCGHSVNKTQLRNLAHSKAFLALLNSRFMDWFFRITSTNNHVQGYELRQLPIPDMTDTDRRQLTNLVDEILAAKAADPACGHVGAGRGNRLDGV